MTACSLGEAATITDELMANDGKGKDITGTGQLEGAGRTNLRDPWTPAEEEAISVLMELMPLLAEASEVARRRRYRREGGSQDTGLQAG